MSAPLELILRGEGDSPRLCSPGVGIFSCAASEGRVLTAGETAGTLAILGTSHRLVVPAGVLARVVSAAPERVREPVGYGTTLYELAAVAPGEDLAGSRADAGAAADEAGLVLRAPHSGRFWQRPAPGDDPFAAAGDVLEEGRAVGLIEVMKTFTHVHYVPGGGELPARGRLLRYRAEDGAEVVEGDPLLEVESA